MFGVLHKHIGGIRKIHGGFTSKWDAAYFRDTQLGRGQLVKYNVVDGMVNQFTYLVNPPSTYDYSPVSGDKAPVEIQLS